MHFSLLRLGLRGLLALGMIAGWSTGTNSWASSSFEPPAEDRPLFPNLRVGGGATLLQNAQLDSFTYFRRPTGTNSPAEAAVFAVFGGLGIGGVFGVLELDETQMQVRDLPGSQESITLEGTRFNGAGMAQAFAGLRYRLNAASALSLSYRFRGTTPPLWTGQSQLDGAEGDWELDLSRLTSHTVSLMVDWKW